MNVADLFSGLSYGEARHLFLGLDGTGEVSDTDKDRIVFFANQALKRIYSRVSHKLHYVMLQLVEGRQLYQIRPIHALSNTDPENTLDRFLIDSTSEPFTGELVKIRAVRLMVDPSNLEAEPVNLLLNTTGRPVVSTTSFDTLRFEEPVADAVYQLELQMAHPKLTIPADPDQEIHLMPILEEALLLKVAASIYGAMNSVDGRTKAQELKNEFEAVMAEVMFEDLAQQSSSHDDDKMARNGWK